MYFLSRQEELVVFRPPYSTPQCSDKGPDPPFILSWKEHSFSLLAFKSLDTEDIVAFSYSGCVAVEILNHWPTYYG